MGEVISLVLFALSAAAFFNWGYWTGYKHAERDAAKRLADAFDNKKED